MPLAEGNTLLSPCALLQPCRTKWSTWQADGMADQHSLDTPALICIAACAA